MTTTSRLTRPNLALFRLLAAFLSRDWFIQLSYRTAFLLSFVGILFRVAIFFFIARFIGEGAQASLAEYGGDYFAFALIGLGVNLYLGLGLSGFARALREAQTTGTLEAMLMTPTPVSVLIVGSAGYSYAFATLQLLIYLLFGWLLGVDFSQANLLPALLGLGLGIISFASIGILAASVIMIIKRGDPITTLIGSLSALVGGVYYPVEVLPGWLQFLAQLVPITPTLRILRLALLNGRDWSALTGDFLHLLAFCVVLAPLSLWVFRRAVEQARRDGSLAQY